MSNLKNQNLCPICFQGNLVLNKKIQCPFIDQKYSLNKCVSCASFSVNLNEHPFDLTKHYNQNEREYDVEFTKSVYWGLQVKKIKSLLKPRSGKSLSILDVGCRTGDFLMHLDSSFEKFGVELNSTNAAIARDRGVTIYNDYIEDIDFDLKFDIITCYALLEHISEPNKVLSKLASLLNQGGLLVIMIPTIECKLRTWLDHKNIHWHMYSPPEHLAYYSRLFLDSFFEKKFIYLKQRRYFSGGIGYKYLISNYKNLLSNASYKQLDHYFNLTVKISGISAIKVKFYSSLIKYIEKYTPISKYPIMDHMYSYYVKK